jgi:hypothetical protein
MGTPDVLALRRTSATMTIFIFLTQAARTQVIATNFPLFDGFFGSRKIAYRSYFFFERRRLKKMQLLVLFLIKAPIFIPPLGTL